MEIVAIACGTCGDVRSAHWCPTACFQCGARYESGAPHALVRVDLEVSMTSLMPRLELDLIGAWSPEVLALVRETLDTS